MELKKCNQPGCKFNEDGKCLEGLGDACSHQFIIDENEENDTNVDSEQKQSKSNAVKLFSGEFIPIEDIKFVSHKFPYRLITVLGDPDCGKTTLLATLFDLFQVGPFHEFLFAGSLTQIGFEKSCHLSRLPSGGDVPDTERTIMTTFQYGHLALKTKDALKEKPIHLLISNIAGEIYLHALENSQSMKEIGFIKKSDFLIIMIDGRKIANLQERSGELFNIYSFIQKAIEEGVFSHNTDLKIVLSKWDLLQKDLDFNFTKIIEEPIIKKFASRLNGISFAKIAARPLVRDESMELGYGIHDLIVEWCQTKDSKGFSIGESKKAVRAFSNYKFKV